MNTTNNCERLGLWWILVHLPLPLIETLIFRRVNEISEISQVYFRAEELTEVIN